METLKHLPIFSNLIIGADCMILLDAIIELHNKYVKVFQKQTGNYKIKWYGGMRLPINSFCVLTGFKRDKVINSLKKMCMGIKHGDNTFRFLENRGEGYYSINVDELDRLEKCIDDYKTGWHRHNDDWEKENGSKLFSVDDIMKTMAKENLNLLKKRFREGYEGGTSMEIE